MRFTIGRTSERFAADLEQLKKESADQIRRSFDSIVTLRDFLSEASTAQQSERYAKLVSKLDSVEKRLSRFEDTLNERVARLIREYDKLKVEVETLAKEKEVYRALYELSDLISTHKNVGVILPSFVQSAADILACDQAILQIVGEDGKILTQYCSAVRNESSIKFKPSKQISEAVLSTGDPVMIESANGSGLGCIVCVPMKSADNVSGLLHAVRSRSPFTKLEMDLLKTLSERIWLAVESTLMATDLTEPRAIMIDDLRERYQFEEIVGDSPEVARILAVVADIASTESAVLIEGDSGTGKELLARALHFNSKRKAEPFVTINCAAIPETLLESELFGYEKGAFTGAVARKPGKFEQANGGTVFMDEIGELPPLLQVKLLRFLQSHEFEPLGSTGVKKADVRIISATKKDLAKMVETGGFRDDLFYRVNVIAIKLPSLVERNGDIEVLAYHFLKKYSMKNSKDINDINDTALAYLKAYDFPGNVRELENIIERAVVLCKGDCLTVNDLPEQVKRMNIEKSEIPNTARELGEIKRKLWRETIGPIEANFALRLLDKSRGNISEAARLGGLHRKQLQRILKRNNLGQGESSREDSG
jgi:transcriptional regulator with GAF, ATPase, and Fis domain